MKIFKIALTVMIFSFFIVNICYAQGITEYFNKGLEYGSAGDFKQAQKAFEKVLELETQPSAKKTIENLLQITNDVLEQRIQSEAGICLFKGVVYSRQFMLDEAIAEIKKAIGTNPKYVLAYKRLAGVYIAKGMLGDAIGEYKKIVEIDPNNAEAHFELAANYYFNKQYKLAIKHSDKAKELGLKDPQLFNLLENLEPYRHE